MQLGTFGEITSLSLQGSLSLCLLRGGTSLKARALLASQRFQPLVSDIVETIFDQLKNISQIEHSRHRSPQNFLVNLMCGLIGYYHQPKKPALAFQINEIQAA